ncbi:MAG: Ig-like domain-containing protein [Bacteroidota bacterium]
MGTGEGWNNGDSGRGLGIWRSTNGGNSFELLPNTNNNSFNFTQKIQVNDQGWVYAATRSGLRRSKDNGQTWSTILNLNTPNAQSNACGDVEIAADGIMYAVLGMNGSGTRVFKSTDQGDSWFYIPIANNGVNLHGNLATRIQIACAPSAPNRLYAMVGRADGSLIGIYRTDNGGQNWLEPGTSSNICGRQCWYDMTISVDPNNADRVIAGGITSALSENGGQNWRSISIGHVDQHEVLFRPGSSSTALYGNDGGVYFIGNANTSQPNPESRNQGYNTIQFYSCAIHPDEGIEYYIGGTQDNGTHRLTELGLGDSQQFLGADGGYCHIDEDNPNIQIGAYQNNVQLITSNNWNGGIKVVDIDAGPFIAPTDYDSKNNVLYAPAESNSYAYISDVGGANELQKVSLSSMGISFSFVSAVKVSPTFNNRVYLGTSFGSIVQIDQANTPNPSASYLGTNANLGYVRCIEIEENNENHMLVTSSQYGRISVWETVDGGVTWTDVEGDLPDMPVWWVIFAPGNSDQALIGTELGIWTTENLDGANTTWEPSIDGLANVRVTMLKHRQTDDRILAATYGRGLFTTDYFTNIDPIEPGTCLNDNTDFQAGFNSWNNFGNAQITTTGGFNDCCAMQVGLSEGGFGQASPTAVVPGERIKLSAWAKAENTNAFAGFGLKFIDANLEQIEDIPIMVTTSNYQSYETTASAPSNAAYVYAWAWKSLEGGILTIDDLCLSKESDDGGDTTPPSISLSTSSPNVTGAFTVNASLSEEVAGFDISDIIVQNGNAQTLVPSTGTTYTFVVTPFSPGAVSIYVAANTMADAAGNPNLRSNDLIVDYQLIGVDGVDLELSLSVDNSQLTIYQNRTYTLTIQNTGDEVATGIKIDFPTPEDMAYVSQSETNGNYANWTGEWTLARLEAGASETLELTLFTLRGTGGISSFAQVSQADQEDIDSSPVNGSCCTANEDDEAVVTIGDDLGDVIRPTVEISTATTTVSDVFFIDVVFSELVNGLNTFDFEVSNGFLGSFTTSDNITYSAEVEPEQFGEITIRLPENVVNDAAGNGNIASNTLVVKYEEEEDNDCINPNTDFRQNMAGWNNFGNTQIVPGGVNDLFAALINGGIGGFGMATSVAVNPGEKAKITAQCQISSTDVIGDIGIKFLDSNFSEISEENVTITDTSYDLYSLTAVAPAGSAYMYAWAYKSSENGALAVDDFCLKKVEEEEEDGVDLELSMTVEPTNPNIYNTFTVTATLSNKGNAAASVVLCHFEAPVGTVFSGGSEYIASQGSYEPYGSKDWSVGIVDAGSEEVIQFNLYLLQTSPVDLYMEVTGLLQTDIDSTPGNGDTTEEDDEASLRVIPNSAPNSRFGSLSEALAQSFQSVLLGQLYPLPAQDLLHLQLHSPSQKRQGLQVYDLQGSLVMERDLDLAKGFNQRTLDIQDLPSGTYFLYLVGDNGPKRLHPFIKQRY